jgi:O-antigen/teichoic acid export membrane protein
LIALRVIPDSLLRKRLELDKVSKAEIISVIVSVPVVLAMAWRGFGVWALATVALLIPLAQGMVIFWFVRWWPGLRMGGRHLRKIIEYSLATLGGRVSWALYQEADTFILGKISGNVILGFYSMAKLIIGLPVEKVSAVVNLVASPVMARLQADREAMRSVLLRGIRLVVWTTWPVSIGMALVGRDFVHVVLTDKWLSLVPVLYVLSVYGVIRSVAVLLTPVLMARYRARFLFGYNVTLLLVMPPAFWVGAAWGAAIGVALAWILVYPILMTRLAHEAFREVGLSWRDLWPELRSPIAAALLMAVAVLAVQWASPILGASPPAARLAVSILIGLTTYGACFIGFGGAVRNEILEVARWLLHRGFAVPVAE